MRFYLKVWTTGKIELYDNNKPTSRSWPSWNEFFKYSVTIPDLKPFKVKS